jgi:hypothetical protein
MKITLSEIRQLVRQELNEAPRRSRRPRIVGHGQEPLNPVVKALNYVGIEDLYQFEADAEEFTLEQCILVLHQLPVKTVKEILNSTKNARTSEDLIIAIKEEIKARLPIY